MRLNNVKSLLFLYLLYWQPYLNYYMIVYSISDIEKLSGVKAHTIRIWEKRYGIIPNRRTNTNIRYYTDNDLQIILNIALLNRKGHKISKIASMDAEEIKQAVVAICEVDEIFEDQIDGLTLAMLELNEYNFLKIVNVHIESKGFEATMDEVLYPFLDKLSIMYIASSVRGAHEAFVTSIIRGKLFAHIEALSAQMKSYSKKFLIFLPEEEGHELSILFLIYLIKSRGGQTLFLGNNVPFVDVVDAIDLFKPNYIFTLFNDSFTEEPLQPYINELSKSAPDAIIGISGYQTIAQKLYLPQNILQFDSLEDIKIFIYNEINKCQAQQFA